MAIERFEDVDPIECDSCHFQTDDLKEYQHGGVGKPKRLVKLCHLCANTMAGNALNIPHAYPNQQAVLRSISYIGNVIIREIRQGRAEPKSLPALSLDRIKALRDELRDYAMSYLLSVEEASIVSGIAGRLSTLLASFEAEPKTGE